MNVTGSVAFMLSSDNRQVDIDFMVHEYINEAYKQADTRGKVTAIFAVFRVADTNWRSFCARLKEQLDKEAHNQFKIENYNEYFIETLAKKHPELYYLCVTQRIFNGHKPNMQQSDLMMMGLDTLKRDRQPRLALRLYNQL